MKKDNKHLVKNKLLDNEELSSLPVEGACSSSYDGVFDEVTKKNFKKIKDDEGAKRSVGAVDVLGDSVDRDLIGLKEAISSLLHSSGVSDKKKNILASTMDFMTKTALIDVFRALYLEVNTLCALDGRKKRIKLKYEIIAKYVEK